MDLIKETEALAYLKKAEHYFNNQDYKGALGSYLKVAEIYSSIYRVGDTAVAYRRIAECYHSMKVPLKDEERKNFIKAVEYYSKAGDEYSKIDEYLKAGDCYENAFKLSEELEEIEKAVEYALKSIKVYEASQDLLSTSHVYLHAARYYEKLGRLELAAESYEKSGDLNLQGSDYRRAANSYTGAAACYKKLGNFEKAINALANSAGANLKLREYSKIAETYDDMAESYLKINDFKNSVYYYKKSAELKFDNKDYAGAGLSYLSIGLMHDSSNDYSSALKSYLQSAESSLSAKSFEQAALAYRKAGDCYVKLKDTLKASEYYVYSAKTNLSAGNEKEAFETYMMAGRNFMEQAETKLLEKDYESAVLYYGKASECYLGIGDFSKAGEIHVRKSEAYLKLGKEKEANESYVAAAEFYLKARDGKSAGYNFKMAGEFEKSALTYASYAEVKIRENDDFSAGEGFKLAARAYAKLGIDPSRRESYNKAIWHYSKLAKQKNDVRLTADAYEGMGECYIDMSDLHNAEKFFQQAFDLYKSIDYQNGINLSSAFLNRVKGELALVVGQHSQAVSMLKDSVNLFQGLLSSGKFDFDYAGYLQEYKDLVENLIYKIEVKPEVDLSVDNHAYAFTDTLLKINGVLSNNGRYTIKSISFLSHLPEEFQIEKLPADLSELKPESQVRVSALINVKRAGEYVVKPFEIFYRDDKGNKYVKSSNDSMISVSERPPEDFKNFRIAVEVYSRYANAQLYNRNYFYAGDGFKKAAEIYGKFNTDEKVGEYYRSSIDAYSEYVKSEPENMSDLASVEKMGDAFWNMGESCDAIGALDDAIKNYRRAIYYYEKSRNNSKIPMGSAFAAELEAKRAIEIGDYQKASTSLSESIELFSDALNKGGLTAANLALIEKRSSEARMLVDKIKETPLILVNIEAPTKCVIESRFKIRISLSNPGEIALRKVKFLFRLPESFVVEDAPSGVFELPSKSSQSITIEVTAKKIGEYKFKPLEISYTDDRNNSYMRGSNQMSISIVARGSDADSSLIEALSSEKPEIGVVFNEVEAPVTKGAKMSLTGFIENTSSVTVSSIRLMPSVPQDFIVSEVPEAIKDLKGKSKEKISMSITPQKEGEYTFKPLEIFYRDAQGNRFFKGSNQVTVKVR